MPVRGPNNESYTEYYAEWTKEQEELGKELLNALNGSAKEKELKLLVVKVEQHYQNYYAAKDGAAKQDVVKVMNPSWKSELENIFMWIGGWRPSMLFQLAYALAGQEIEAAYTLAGQDIEAGLAEFLNGLDTPTLASLSAKQLSEISKLQIQTQKAEDELGHRQAVVQQSLADQPQFLLAHANSLHHSYGGGSPLREVVHEKVQDQGVLLTSADDLRFETLKEFLNILTTTQAAQYLVSAGQFHSSVRKIGWERQQDGSTEEL